MVLRKNSKLVAQLLMFKNALILQQIEIGDRG